MKTLSASKYGSFLTIFIIVIFTTTAFTFVNNGMTGPGDPVKLTYNFNEGKSIQYRSMTGITQGIEVNGQTYNTLIESNLSFKVKLAGNAGENLKLQILLDSLSTKVESMQGSSGAKIKDVEGKTFNMLLSPIGKEIDMSEAEKIEYSVEGAPAGNISTSFVQIFPDLPEKAIKEGDTWTKVDTLNTSTSASKTTQIIQSTSKFEGIEKINGLECAKITSVMSGTTKANVQNMGMDILMSGPFKGTVTLYFAIKEGYFVKQEVSSVMTGTVETSGPQSASYPLTMNTTGKIEVVK